jgi:hypothetical protein
MEKQKKDNTDNEEFKDTDQGFNARNQYSGSGDFSPDEQEGSEDDNIQSSLNSNEKPESPTDLQQDESGTLKSNN